MNKDLTIGQRLERLVYNANNYFVWWRLEQESENLYRFMGGVPEGDRGEVSMWCAEAPNLLDLLAITWGEGLEDPIP